MDEEKRMNKTEKELWRAVDSAVFGTNEPAALKGKRKARDARRAPNPRGMGDNDNSAGIATNVGGNRRSNLANELETGKEDGEIRKKHR